MFCIKQKEKKNIYVSFADNRKKQTFTIVLLLHVKQKKENNTKRILG